MILWESHFSIFDFVLWFCGAKYLQNSIHVCTPPHIQGRYGLHGKWWIRGSVECALRSLDVCIGCWTTFLQRVSTEFPAPQAENDEEFGCLWLLPAPALACCHWRVQEWSYWISWFFESTTGTLHWPVRPQRVSTADSLWLSEGNARDSTKHFERLIARGGQLWPKRPVSQVKTILWDVPSGYSK